MVSSKYVSKIGTNLLLASCFLTIAKQFSFATHAKYNENGHCEYVKETRLEENCQINILEKKGQDQKQEKMYETTVNERVTKIRQL